VCVCVCMYVSAEKPVKQNYSRNIKLKLPECSLRREATAGRKTARMLRRIIINNRFSLQPFSITIFALPKKINCGEFEPRHDKRLAAGCSKDFFRVSVSRNEAL
jgi:hypothetical protein